MAGIPVDMKQGEFAELVKSARTHRRYNAADPIARETLISFIDLARNIPSAMNAQPLRYRVVSEPDEVAAVFECTNWAKGLRTGPAPTPAQRPTGWIVILSHKPQINPGIDVGIAGQTLQLAAASAGYAACMLLSIDKTRIAQVLRLPVEINIELLMSFGRPGEKVVIEPLTPQSQTPYWRTPDQAHHVPKRSLKEVLI